MLNEMRQLLEAYAVTNSQTNAVVRKLFLDKLPAQARTILIGSLENNLNSLALREDEIMVALSQNTITFHSSSKQQLINEIFDQKLNKTIEQYKRQTRKFFQHRNFNLSSITTITDLHHVIDFSMGRDKLTDLTQLIKDVIFINQKTTKFDIVGRRC